MSDVTKHINYQNLRDIAARDDPEEGIRQGLEDVKKGRVRPAREFLAVFEAEHGIRKQGSGHCVAPKKH
jgi:predicted transcriptional regulator